MHRATDEAVGEAFLREAHSAWRHATSASAIAWANSTTPRCGGGRRRR